MYIKYIFEKNLFSWMKVSSASQYDSYYKESQSVIRIQNKLHFDVMIP